MTGDECPRDDSSVGDDQVASPHEDMHPADGVFPVIVAEPTVERRVQQPTKRVQLLLGQVSGPTHFEIGHELSVALCAGCTVRRERYP